MDDQDFYDDFTDDQDTESEADQNHFTASSANARKGFFIMLAGPAILFIVLVIKAIGFLPDIFVLVLGLICAVIAFFLPLVGLIFAIKSLIHRKELDKTGRAAAIITCVMCNPLFYFLYFFMCFSAGFSLSGGAMM
jgi:uncharacterized membrane protein YhaH (DUF805 family)